MANWNEVTTEDIIATIARARKLDANTRGAIDAYERRCGADWRAFNRPLWSAWQDENETPHQRAAKFKKAQLVDMFVKERGSVYGTGPKHRAETRRFFSEKPKVALVMLAVSEGLVK